MKKGRETERPLNIIMKVNTYIVTHKEFSPPLVEGRGTYTPIQVGKQFSGKDLGYISDDTGDNIAEKNLNYCELTALYWIWKNDMEADIVGLCHYRRYLTRKIISISKDKILTDRIIEKILDKYDMIVPDRTKYPKEITIRDKWIRCHNFSGDLDKTRNVLDKLYPEYVSDYDQVLLDNSAHFYNIMITSKKLLNAYCKWLFEICNEMETVMDMKDYNSTQGRFYGLLSEILLDVWCEHNNIRRYYCRMIETELDYKQSYKNAVKRIRDRLFIKG